MTYREVVIMRNNLDLVNAIADVDPRFLYAVSRNKARLDSIIKTLDKLKEPSEEINEFWRELDEINKKHAERDESGSVLYSQVKIGDEFKKAYKKVIGEGNPDSAYTKDVDKLKKRFKADVDKYEAAVKSYNKMLDAEMPPDDFRIFWIDLAIIPRGLNPKAMDGVLNFTKPLPEETEEPAGKESNLKKT